MERSKEIEAELSGIAPALGKNGISVQPYQVPAGYFEHFAENLLPKTLLMASSQRSTIQTPVLRHS